MPAEYALGQKACVKALQRKIASDKGEINTVRNNAKSQNGLGWIQSKKAALRR